MLDHDRVHGQDRGIFLVEVGVAVTVAAIMMTIFYAFAVGRSGSDDERGELPDAGEPFAATTLRRHRLLMVAGSTSSSRAATW